MIKRLLVFHGPPHHAQLLDPVEQALAARGWEIVRYTADTESCFQEGLNARYGEDSYLWLPDFTPKEKALRLYHRHVGQFRAVYERPGPLSLAIPQVLDRIVQACCREWVGTKALLAHVKPAAALALHEINRWGMMLGARCAQAHVPFWTLQEGMYYGDPWLYTGHTRYSQSLIWGEETREILLHAGADPTRLHIVGHPDLAHRVEAGRLPLLTDAVPALNGKIPVLLFVGLVSLDQNPAPLFAGLAESPWHLLIKPHQLVSAPLLEQLQTIANQYPAVTLMGFENDLMWPLLVQCPMALITGCSTTALEWHAVSEILRTPRPLGVIRLPTMGRDLVAEGLAMEATTSPFAETLRVMSTGWDAAYQERVSAFVAKSLADFCSAPRIGAAIDTGRW